MKNFEKLTKEELKSINAGGTSTIECVPYPMCNGEEIYPSIGQNRCGWILYKTAVGSICMEYSH
ncbi:MULTISPECIES: hypothetical protein [Flavobacterium]|uniref:Bacteriocin n=1 Tax=Flavobacterium lipolyticum TaxID=2893754 RepID=A0ABS8LY30_9FLAO|nr:MULTISPECIES: hypothetical protein [unclassified Flavobacterium]MCC9017482.1 hypothetical protein [Flavobacterium sp. F-126]